jgi:hypothetical protein
MAREKVELWVTGLHESEELLQGMSVLKQESKKLAE